jgi:hypothetical protein
MALVHASPRSTVGNRGGASAAALGVTHGKRPGEYRLAVRLRGGAMARALAEEINRAAHGEADIRVIRRIVKRARTPWHQARQRPLMIGASVAHVDVTAGTLGAFVRRRERDNGEVFVLSNNHVLANESRAARGDSVLQQSPHDDGVDPDERIGVFSKAIALRPDRPNLVDAAIAVLDDGMEFFSSWLRGGATELRGQRRAFLAPGERVWKLGRTSGLTRGVVSAIELDNVLVGFDIGDLSFDNQIEVRGSGRRPFSDGGDSGSLILDEDGRACALLFAGGAADDGTDRTYANPIETVLDKLKVDLVI